MLSTVNVHKKNITCLAWYRTHDPNGNVNIFSYVIFCFVLFCFVLFCFVLFCFVLFCFVLFCFVLFCFVLFAPVKLKKSVQRKNIPRAVLEHLVCLIPILIQQFVYNLGNIFPEILSS